MYEEILYKHWPFPTAFSTASWLLNILLPKKRGGKVRYFLVKSATSHRKRIFTSSCRLHPTRQTQTAESIIEYLIEFQGSCSVVSYFNTGCQAVKNPVPPQNRLRLRRYKHARLRIAKYVVLLQNTCRDENHDYVFFSIRYNIFNFILYICVQRFLNFYYALYKAFKELLSNYYRIIYFLNRLLAMLLIYTEDFFSINSLP